MKKQNYILGVDMGDSKICSLIAEVDDKKPRILGVGIAHSKGIQKGEVKSIDSASKALKESLDEARRMAGVDIDKAFIALSGNSAKSENINEVMNLQLNCEIGVKEIHSIMQQVELTARGKIPSSYELVHIVPYSFRLDKSEYIDEPLGMIGSRLEVSAKIIYAHKADLANLKKVAQNAGLEVAGVVLNAYASAIAVLSDEERAMGACCIDMGSGSCNFMIHRGNAMQYEDFLPAGSWNVTNDIATKLGTTLETAEFIKKDFANLKDLTQEDAEMTLEKVPLRGGETCNVKYEVLHDIVSSRVVDMVQRIKQSITQSGLKGAMGAGVVITGGMSSMNGLKDLVKKVFGKTTVRIAEPKQINKSFDIIRKIGEQKAMPYSCFSTAIGVILYATNGFTNYEVDSNCKMKFK